MLKFLKRWTGRLLGLLLLFIILGMLLPENIQMPVEGANNGDFNRNSFWFYPWGKSITHKGVDIFAPKGRSIYSACEGLVVSVGKNDMGGNYVMVLGPRWRFHYYAHLQDIKTNRFAWVNHDSEIGTVGDSGNAKGKPSHLHYTIATFIPQVNNWGAEHQRWKKLFYVDPIPYIRQ